MSDELTQDELKKRLIYDASSGIFSRIITAKSKNLKVGYIRKDGYRYIRGDKKQYLAHRLVWLYVNGKFPNKLIDHINGIKDDNRICNLREANNSQNGMNKTKLKNNTSGYKGVCLDKKSGKWVAQTRVDGRKKLIGRYESPEDASKAYDDFTKKSHGEFYYKVYGDINDKQI